MDQFAPVTLDQANMQFAMTVSKPPQKFANGIPISIKHRSEVLEKVRTTLPLHSGLA
jgi:hypothetical protein